ARYPHLEEQRSLIATLKADCVNKPFAQRCRDLETIIEELPAKVTWMASLWAGTFAACREEQTPMNILWLWISWIPGELIHFSTD
uniref:Uncharacterized protein n=1 Tax=Zonotrichia albicollis TaxID=44394 RepID=A0A8D2MS72_ZONAL